MYFRRVFLIGLYKFSDIIILFFSLFFAVFICVYGGKPFALSNLLSAQVKVQNFVILIIITVSWGITFRYFNLYQTKRLGNKLHECWDILKATTLGTCIIVSLISVFHTFDFSGIFIVSFWISSTFLTMAVRMTMRVFLAKMRNMGRNLRHVIIIGTNQRAQSFAKVIRRRKDLGYNLLGFVDNKYPDTSDHTGLLSDLNHFSELLKLHVIDEVVIGLPIKSFYEEIKKIVLLCEEQGIMVRFITELFDLQLSESRVDYLEGSPILTLYTGPLNVWCLGFKRTIDILFSATVLLLFFPFFIVVGILIRLDSPGSIFFVQERVGYNKRRFKVYKFRTMIRDAGIKQSELENLNEMSGPVFKIKDDPRITTIGKVLRKTSIDELPQLFNVLKGDMSLVGPRPLPVRDFNGFEKNWQKRRFSIRPGLTCLWQVNGRNKITFEKWMELDMEYIDNWSLLLDAKILLKTILVVFKGSGAC